MTSGSSANLQRSAFGYLRVSGLSQAAEDRGGLPRQREALLSYCSAKGIAITRWFEEAYTGTDLEGRPAFREMRAALLENGVRTVIVEKLDRLARDLMIQENILADFRKHGIELLSATPGEEDLCSGDPTRKFIRQVLGAVAEFDRSNLVSRMKAGKARARANGKRCGGRASYPSPRHPGEVEIVNRVYHLRRNGFNAAKIAQELTFQGYKTRKGTKFSAMQVSRILRSTQKTTEAAQCQ